MAGSDEIRRSVRASRITKQPSTGSKHSSSTSSQSSLNHRHERPSRLDTTNNHSRKNTHPDPRSPNSHQDSNNIAATIESPHKMRTTRRNTQTVDDALAKSASEVIEDADEDDGTVRCLCGRADYPGPPQCLDEDRKQYGDLDFITSQDVTEETAGFFLQCDTCKVWQHGGCVGIKNEEVSPDEYFCEQCRTSLHKRFIAANGQKYSLYLPLQPNYSPSTSRAGSFSKDGDPRARGSSLLHNAKRRSTMNSRVAYDEEEQLRLAIEASKGDNAESIDGGAPSTTKRGRRGQSDSASLDKQSSTKRARSFSASDESNRSSPDADLKYEPNEESKARDNQTSKRIYKGVVARQDSVQDSQNHKDKIHSESSNKRNGRAERRRADGDSEHSEHSPPMPPRTKAKSSPPPPQQADIDLPPAATTTTTAETSAPLTATTASSAPTPSHKKGGRPPSTKKGKLGRNQYTKNAATSTVNGKFNEKADEDERVQSTSKEPSNAKDALPGAQETNALNSSNNNFSLTKANKKKTAAYGGAGTNARSNSKISLGDPQRQIDHIRMQMSRLYAEQAEDGLRLAGTGLKVPLVTAIEDGDGDSGDLAKHDDIDDATGQARILMKQLDKWMAEFGPKVSV